MIEISIRARIQRYISIESVSLFLILALAAFLRFYRLDTIPPGLNNDEAFDLLDILDTLRGQFSIFFPANTGREPLWFYLNAATVAFFGANAFALRVTAALVGTITVGLVYGFARALFRSKMTAALAACFLAISTWHLFSSRYGLRIILAAMLTLLALWWFWRGLDMPTKRRYFVLAGLCTSLALYTHVTSRLLPFLLIALTAFASLANRSRARDYFVGLVTAGVVALIIFLPLGAYFATHLDDFMGHTANLSIFDVRMNQGNIPLALWNNTVLVVGSFLVRGDHEAYRNVVFRPVFDPFSGAFFVIGVVVLMVTLLARRSSFKARARAFLIGAWLACWMISTITSDDAPNFLRMLPGVSPAMMLAAWGVSAVWNRLRGEKTRRIAAVAFATMMIVSGVSAFHDYVDFGQSGAAYLGFDGHVADAATWVDENAVTSQIYMAPLWAIQGTMRVMTRNIPVKSYESRDTVILPSNAAGKDALIVYPWEQTKKAQTLGQRLGALGVREDLTGTLGFPVALAIRVPAKNLPDESNPLAALANGGDFIQPQKVERATWSDQFEMLGYSIQAVDAPKRNLEVTLFFHALKPIAEDYTFSVKVRDAEDRTWGQEDKWTGDNSYATTQWSPGDVIIEKFYPGLNACAPDGDYHVSVEVYNPKTMQLLGNVVSLGTWHANASQGNRMEDLEIAHPLDIEIAPQAQLLGYTLSSADMRGGDVFSLSLFWRGNGNGNTSQVSVQLKNATAATTLASTSMNIPSQDRGLCSFFDLHVPVDFPAGAASVWVNNSKIADMQIVR